MTFAIAGLVRLAPLLLAGAVICSARPAAAEFKDFRDWLAVCDNLRNCAAYGFVAGDEPSSAYVFIARGGAPAATARITIDADVDDNVKVALSFDDAALHGLPEGPLAFGKGDDGGFGHVVIDDPAAVDTALASMRKAQTLVVRRIDPPGGPKIEQETSKISLSGLVAALLWIDEQQQRLDTKTALVRRGDRPVSSIQPPPGAPSVRAAKPPPDKPTPDKPLPAADMRLLTAKVRSLCNDDHHVNLEDTFRLTADSALYDFTCPDFSGAYNQTSVFLIVPDGRPQAARPVKFVYPAGVATGAAEAGSVVATNAGFDPSTMTLSTFNKGRGVADCGAAEDWVFDGQTFQLVMLRAMPHCKGVASDDWPVHYQAEAK